MFVITNNDLILFFLVGVAGASINEATRLIGNNLTRVRVENKTVPLKVTIPIFIIVGGVVTLMYEMHIGVPFAETNAWKIVVIGFFWQALFKSYTPPIANQREKELTDELNRTKRKLKKTEKDYIDVLKGAKKGSTG